MKHAFVLATLLAALTTTSALQAQQLLVPNSTTDQVYLISGTDGSLISDQFLDVATQASNAGVGSTPIEAIEVGNEFWVSDQIADRIWRFGRDRSFLGDIGAGQLNNIRGMEVVGNTVYVAQGSDGTGGVNEGIVTIDTATRQITGGFNGRDAADTSYFDVKFFNGELLVSNIDSGNDGIERYSLDGDFLGFFAQSDGLTSFDFAQQINVRSNGNLIVGGFSVPSGVFEFAPDGTNLGIIAAEGFGPRAGFELGDGNIAWTNGSQIGTDAGALVSGASFRFFGTTSAIPEPSAAGVLALAGLFLARRRRV